MNRRFGYILGFGQGVLAPPLLTPEQSERLVNTAEDDLGEIHFGLVAIGNALQSLKPDECGAEVLAALGALTTFLGEFAVAVNGVRSFASPQWQECLRESREHQARARLREVAGAQG